MVKRLMLMYGRRHLKGLLSFGGPLGGGPEVGAYFHADYFSDSYFGNYA